MAYACVDNTTLALVIAERSLKYAPLISFDHIKADMQYARRQTVAGSSFPSRCEMHRDDGGGDSSVVRAPDS